LNNRITILPRLVIGSEKETLLSACKLFVLPSLSENFGNAALEAAIRGKPIIVSEEAGVATLVRDHQCGLTCRPNAKDISRSIKKLLNDPERSRKMGEQGRSAALSCYTWPVIARKMSTLYEGIIKGDRPNHSMLSHITPVILTLNEESNIKRTLSALDWAEQIIVVDSGSTDSTLEILAADSRVTVFNRKFDTYGAQWDFAVNRTDIHTDWVLRLDADYVITPELRAELAKLDPNASVSAYRIAFDYIVCGRRLRGTIYPSNTVLFRKGRATPFDRGHTDAWTIDGQVGKLKGRILHDDRKPLARWFASQQRYATENANYLLSSPAANLDMADRARLSGWAAPLGVFFYVLFVKGCIFDGRLGWYYALQRVTAEILLALELTDRRHRGISEQ
jgi:hypothetical protein